MTFRHNNCLCSRLCSESVSLFNKLNTEAGACMRVMAASAPPLLLCRVRNGHSKLEIWSKTLSRPHHRASELLQVKTLYDHSILTSDIVESDWIHAR